MTTDPPGTTMSRKINTVLYTIYTETALCLWKRLYLASTNINYTCSVRLCIIKLYNQCCSVQIVAAILKT